MATTVLIDETDTRLRLIQHGAVLAGVVLLFLAAGVAARDQWLLMSGLIGAGLAGLALSASTSQRWTADHRGHRIAFVNNPILGEKLFVDDVLVARGRLGVHSEMRAEIPAGDGQGDRIVARSEAGLVTFRCHVEAIAAAS